MHQEQENSWENPSRQPVSGMMLAVVKAILQMVKVFWPFIIFLFIRENKANGQDGIYLQLLIIIPLLSIIRSVIDYFYLRFYIQNKNLVLRKGFLSKKIITIPLERIHTVNLDQNILHKAFNITSLKIDTAGSSKSEAVIDAIEYNKAQALKKFLLAESNTESDEPEVTGLESDNKFQKQQKDEVILSAGVNDIFKIGITANHIQAFFIIFAFLVSAVQNLEEIFGDRVINLLRESATGIAYTINIVLSLGLTVLIITIIVSLIRSVLLYMNFVLTETARGYKIKWGLINTREILIPFDKIQYISWKANWIRNMLGIYMLDFHQATTTETDNRKTKMYIPLTKKENIPVLLNQYHYAIDLPENDYIQIDKRYVFRKTFTRGFPIAILAVLATYFWWEANSFWFLLYIPFEYFSAWVFRKKFRLYLHPEVLQVIRGVWGKEVEVLKWYKVQVPQIRRTLYQRRKGLATVKLNTAGGTVVIPFINFEMAMKIYNRALYKIETHTTVPGEL